MSEIRLYGAWTICLLVPTDHHSVIGILMKSLKRARKMNFLTILKVFINKCNDHRWTIYIKFSCATIAAAAAADDGG